MIRSNVWTKTVTALKFGSFVVQVVAVGVKNEIKLYIENKLRERKQS